MTVGGGVGGGRHTFIGHEGTRPLPPPTLADGGSGLKIRGGEERKRISSIIQSRPPWEGATLGREPFKRHRSSPPLQIDSHLRHSQLWRVEAQTKLANTLLGRGINPKKISCPPGSERPDRSEATAGLSEAGEEEDTRWF